MPTANKSKSKTALTEELRAIRRNYKSLSKIWLDQIEATKRAQAKAAELTAELEALRRISEQQSELIERQKRLIEEQADLIKNKMDRTTPTKATATATATKREKRQGRRREWEPRRRRIR